MVHPLIFDFLAALTVLCAIAVVTVKNIFHAGLFLIGSFLGVAGLYVTLHDFFLAAVQLLIYSGAIAVLILFGIMMTQRAKTPKEPSHNPLWLLAIVAGLGFLKFLIGNYDLVVWDPLTATQAQLALLDQMVQGIGHTLMQGYLLPFELISVVLLAALVGAVALAKEKEDA